MGSQQLVGFVGPALAGIIIGANSQSTLGIVVAFVVDALTFGISAFALGLMRNGNGQAVQPNENILSSLWESVIYLWNHGTLRYMFTIMAAVNFLFTGPLLVGIPVLAEQRLAEGATAFGLLMTAYAGGNLAGMVFAGILPKPTGERFRILMIALLIGFGIVLACFGWITNTWINFALILTLGLGNGYFGLVLFTWIQQRTPREMLGRVMSMVMLASMGLVPLSQIVSGVISRSDLTLLFVSSGGLILLTTLWAAFQPALKLLSNEMVGE
jgi:MFS family permease